MFIKSKLYLSHTLSRAPCCDEILLKIAFKQIKVISSAPKSLGNQTIALNDFRWCFLCDFMLRNDQA